MQEDPTVEKSVTPMRSFVVEPMQHGRLFLAGDAVHRYLSPQGSGLNLALHDVRFLADALVSFYESGSEAGLDAYSAKCLGRVWRSEHFSWWMTSMLHLGWDGDEYEQRVRCSSWVPRPSWGGCVTSLAENYVGTAKT